MYGMYVCMWHVCIICMYVCVIICMAIIWYVCIVIIMKSMYGYVCECMAMAMANNGDNVYVQAWHICTCMHERGAVA
jgi:hypothetical protein